MLNDYMTTSTLLIMHIQFFSLISVTLLLILVQKKSNSILYISKKLGRRVVLILLWILTLLPVSSLFLIKINILSNTSTPVTLAIIALLFINTTSLVVYWWSITDKQKSVKINNLGSTYEYLLTVCFFIFVNIIYFIWVLLLI